MIHPIELKKPEKTQTPWWVKNFFWYITGMKESELQNLGNWKLSEKNTFKTLNNDKLYEKIYNNNRPQKMARITT